MSQDLVVAKVGLGRYGTVNRALDHAVPWILPTLSGLLIILLATALTDFYYPHAWNSAHFATIVRAFANHGIFALHGIPIGNYDPLTTEPDSYLHWPPLFFYVLSLVIRIFPDSIRTMHLFMAAIAIANAVVMWRIAAMFFGPRAAVVCGGAFLLMPATLRWGLLLLNANLALLEVSIALLFMLRYLQGGDAGHRTSRYLWLSAVAFFLACITSWEPYLALPGLLLACGMDRRAALLKICLCWALAATAAGGSILALYSLSDPTFFEELWSIFTFRIGLTHYLPLPARIHPIEGTAEAVSGQSPFSTLNSFMYTYVARTYDNGGALAIVGCLALLLTVLRDRRRGPTNLLAALLLPLATIWLGWAVLMQQHYFVHEFQLILATPILALAIACLYGLLEDIHFAAPDTWLRQTFGAFINLGVPCALLVPAIIAVWITGSSDEAAKSLADFGRRINAEVPTGAIVLISDDSMVPTFYAERHVVRGIANTAYLESHLGLIRGLCEECPFYLALQRENEEKFRDLRIPMQPIFADDKFIIRKIK